MRPEKPKILVTATRLETGSDGNNVLDSQSQLCFDAIRRAGGYPEIITPADSEIERHTKYQQAGGILFTGGEDIHPASLSPTPYEILREQPDLLGENPGLLGETVPERDEMEIWLVELALRDEKPIEAICRGMQLLNAVRGGTLYLDIAFETGTEIDHELSRGPDKTKIAHAVIMDPNSLTAQEIGADNYQTNSSHHMAIKEPGKGIVVVGRAPDGIVEKIEMPGERHVRGSQDHAESLAPTMAIMQKTFERLVESAYLFRKQLPELPLAQSA